MRNILILMSISVLMLISTVSISFAEIPTPQNEWDFDFLDVRVSQDYSNPHNLIIKPNILYKGMMPEGTVKIDVEITQPDGEILPAGGMMIDMETGDTRSTGILAFVNQEGDYVINLKMTPPEEPYLDHTFDTFTLEYTIPENGFEKELNLFLDENDNSIIYRIEKPSTIKEHEGVHTVMNLPQDNTFDSIAIVNDQKIIKYFPVDTKEFHLISDVGFNNLEIHLVKEGNLFPIAYAQGSMNDYVTTYKISKDICSDFDCLDITIIETVEEEFPYWMLSFLLIVVIAYPIFKFIKKCEKQFGNSYFENSPTSQAI